VTKHSFTRFSYHLRQHAQLFLLNRFSDMYSQLIFFYCRFEKFAILDFFFYFPIGHVKSHIQTCAGTLLTDCRSTAFNKNNNNRHISNVCLVCFIEITKYIHVARSALLPKLRLMYRNKKMAFLQKRMTKCNEVYGITVNLLNATPI
jgi:hypothetical protein